MASADQPLKKRKLYDAFPDPAILPHQIFVAPPPPLSSPPFSQEEILRRRRNREEIRSLYDCYRRIRFCVSGKDARLMPDFEQAYLSLITASRGCTSVQRIVAELIPRYASFCPTALEAAAKVSINMYNWSLAIIMRGEDADGVAYQTAKACIFGLVDICCTASYEAPTSSVIRGICAAVFLNVLTFFTTTFEDKDIYQIGSREILKLQEPMEFFYDLKQEQADDNEPPLYKLFKFRALCLLRIFFSFPKKVLAACFELFVTSGTDVVNHKRGLYFLNQLTSHLNADGVAHALNKTNDTAPLCTDSAQAGTDCRGSSEEEPLSNDNNVPGKSLLLSKNCFMGMAVNREPSLRGWILSRYKKLCESLSSQAISEISSLLEKVFGSLPELVNEADSEESDEDNLDPSKYVNRPFAIYQIPIQHDNNAGASSRDRSLGVTDALYEDNDAAGKDGGQIVKPFQSVLPREVDVQSVNNRDRERSVSTKNLEIGDRDDSCLDRTSTPKHLTSNQFIPVVTRKQPDFKNDDSYVESHVVKVEKIQGSNVDLGLPASLSSSGGVHNIFPSPRQQSTAQYHASFNQILWYSDGDSAAVDVFSASKQLWLGSLGHDASEMLVRMQFEDFGPLEHLLFVPTKDFALIEYRNIMDAVKAREYMQGSSPWGGCLRIKFVDKGLGSRGAVNGVAVGDSCHVYIGKVSTQWAKDEILHELMKVGLRHPRMVIDLTSESALLLEFWTAEEAATAMVHIRHQRNKSLTLNACSKDKFVSNCQLLVRQIDASVSDEELINAFSRFGELTRWQFNRPGGFCFIDFQSYQAAELAKSHLHGARFGPTSIHVEFRISSPGTVASNMVLSPPAPTLHDSSIGSCRTRISQLSSFFSSLCAKYKINQNASSYGGHNSKQYYHPTAMRDEDRVTTNILWIGLPDIPSPIFTDDELMALSKLAVGHAGSVVRLTRASMQSSCWFVEFSSVDAAVTALKNIRSCPGMFLQIEFRNSGDALYHDERQPTSGKSNESGYFPCHGDLYSTGLESMPGNPYPSSFTNKPDASIPELVSPRAKMENLGTPIHRGHAFQSNWTIPSSAEMLEAGSRKVGDFGGIMPLNHSFAEVPATSHVAEQVWQYKKQEIEPQIMAQGILPCPPVSMHGGSMIPPPIQPPSFVRPLYLYPSNSWDNSAPNPIGMMPTDNRCPAVPFIPSSITPLSQLPSGSMQRFDQMVTVPGLPSLVPPPPPLDAAPPLPSSPPPLPLSQPPCLPPPPSSPPPLQHALEPSNVQSGEPCVYYQWQGTLSKSGVHYCTIYATREDSAACKYSNAVSEPADWPARLDITKRTDFRHVKTTFASTPPHKREVCRLLPSTTGDHKGFHDFISYLKQRECAGVIKISAGNSLWARLLFILPHSLDTCSLLAISPHPADCLIALLLPKETNPEGV